MRIVYDASAKISSKTLSLNDCLHTGPNLIQRLQSMLLAFRSHKIAFTADIEKAFLQIELNTQDRDATRFLCLKDVDKLTNNPENVVVYRFCRVLFGAAPNTPSPRQTRRLDITRLTKTFDIHGQCPYWSGHCTRSLGVLHILKKMLPKGRYESATPLL